MKKRRIGIQKKSGTTLVEMIVSMLLVEILAIMVIGVISPAAKVFARLQQMQFAQMILDNVEEEMKSQVLNAVTAVKLYDGSPLGAASDSGSVLEFINTDGYVVLLSAEGCEDTEIVRGTTETGSSGAVDTGKLLMRYYWPEIKADNTYTYTYQKNGKLVARAVNPVFTDKYYMGNYLTLQFQYPAGVEEGDNVTSLTATVSLYKDKACTELLATDDFVLNIRYQAKRMPNLSETAVVVTE